MANNILLVNLHTSVEFGYLPKLGLVTNLGRCFNGTWMKDTIEFTQKLWDVSPNGKALFCSEMKFANVTTKTKIAFKDDHKVCKNLSVNFTFRVESTWWVSNGNTGGIWINIYGSDLFLILQIHACVNSEWQYRFGRRNDAFDLVDIYHEALMSLASNVMRPEPNISEFLEYEYYYDVLDVASGDIVDQFESPDPFYLKSNGDGKLNLIY